MSGRWAKFPFFSHPTLQGFWWFSLSSFIGAEPVINQPHRSVSHPPKRGKRWSGSDTLPVQSHIPWQAHELAQEFLSFLVSAACKQKLGSCTCHPPSVTPIESGVKAALIRWSVSWCLGIFCACFVQITTEYPALHRSCTKPARPSIREANAIAVRSTE